MIPEAQARVQIDQLLQCAGWHVCCIDQVNLQAFPGIAIRDCHLNPGQGFADYLLYMNGKACGVIEAKKVRVPLKGVELQSARYAQGLPAALPKRPSGRPGMPARFFLPSTPYTHSSSLAMSSSCSTFMGIREVEAQIDPNLQRA